MSCSLKANLRELQTLVSCTASHYQRLYLDFIDNAATYIKNDDLIDIALTKAIAVLKIRRAYMLPTGADAETCYQQQEVWTYAAFTAVVLKTIFSANEVTSQLSHLKKYLPETGLAWLNSYPELWEAWQSFLVERPPNTNTFTRLVEAVEAPTKKDLSTGK